MNWTDAAAWLGAATGTAALVWDIFKWTRGGPRIHVSVSGDMEALDKSHCEEDVGSHVVIQVINNGTTKTTITHVVGFYYDAAWKRWLRRKATRSMVVMDPAPGKLPHELDVGQRWVGMMNQSEIEDLCKTGRVYCGVIHSLAQKPVVKRLMLQESETRGVAYRA